LCGVWVLPPCSDVAPRGIPRSDVAFLERGVGDGSVREGVAGAGIGGRPRGVREREGDVRFAARGGLTLVATGVEGPASGVVLVAVLG
jgi:hypothetical protein